VWSGCEKTFVSLNGLALVGAPNHPGSLVGYLGDGTGFNVNQGHTFSYAPIQLPHGAEIKKLTCVVRDNTPVGYLQVHLQRGPIAATSPPLAEGIAVVVTYAETASPDFQEISGDSSNPPAAIVDNTKYGYFLRVDFLDAPELAGPEAPLKVRGCSVELGI
jgi:hypothetical protein